MVIVRSGNNRCLAKHCGLFFWGVHEHDSIWHIAIIESAFVSFPPRVPVFAGELLRGYNYILDFVILVVSRMFNLSSLFVFFKLMPFLLIACLIFLSKKLVGKKAETQNLFFWLLFFVFFSGSFSYFLTLWHEGSIWNNQSLLAMPPGLMLTNLQYTASLVFVLWFLVVVKSVRILNLRHSLLLSLLVAASLAIKFYAGIILEAMFVIYLLLMFLQGKKFVFIVRSFLLNLILFIAVILFVYQPNFAEGKNIFEFRFLANIHPFIEEKSLFYLLGYANARYMLQNLGVGPKLIFIESLTFGLFMLFSFGTRVIGVVYYLYLLLKKQLRIYHHLSFVGIIVGVACSSLLVQRGMWWNTIQFLYYSLFFASILAAEAIYKLLQKKSLVIKCLISIVVITLTIPNSLAIIREFSSNVGISYIPKQELRALEFLKNQEDGVVLTYPYVYSIAKWEPITKMSKFSDNAYVAAFSGKQTFINDTHVLEILGINYQQRQNLTESFFKKKLSESQARKFLIKNKIVYIYLAKSHLLYTKRFVYNPAKIGIKKIFDNKEVTIYKVN